MSPGSGACSHWAASHAKSACSSARQGAAPGDSAHATTARSARRCSREKNLIRAMDTFSRGVRRPSRAAPSLRACTREATLGVMRLRTEDSQQRETGNQSAA
eukprot:4061435-Lingulodinium_polyedra.AAC.1